VNDLVKYPMLKAVPGIILENECDVCENKMGQLHLWHCVFRDPNHYQDSDGSIVYTGPSKVEANMLRRKHVELHAALHQLGVFVQGDTWHLRLCLTAQLTSGKTECIDACRKARKALYDP
jgi:hypothetical protein